MSSRALIGLGCAMAVVACTSPPKPPTVDDSRKRPVNVTEAVNLQMCRTELSAAKIVLNEALATHPAAMRASARPTTFPTSAADRPEVNQVFVIGFPFASADLSLSAEEKARLVDQARGAQWIVIRGRTDALADSMADTRLAKRRAEAAYNYLTSEARLPPDVIRVSWQGAGDPLRPSDMQPGGRTNRRVEIEMYQAKPVIHVLGGAKT